MFLVIATTTAACGGGRGRGPSDDTTHVPGEDGGYVTGDGGSTGSITDPACTVRCTDRRCGSDGCGGSCGSCAGGEVCTSAGQCLASGRSCDQGCPPGSYCDLGAGACVAGCRGDDNCLANQTCDASSNECVDREERCNGADDDLDGAVDETFGGLGGACDGDDADQCASGVYACTPDGLGTLCDGDLPSIERCNSVDDDCDGSIDEDYPDLGQACDGEDADTCENGTWTCSTDGMTIVCGGDQMRREICNGVDDDCDGTVDRHVETTTVRWPSGYQYVYGLRFADDGTYFFAANSTSGGRLFRGHPDGTVDALDVLPGRAVDLDVYEDQVAILVRDGDATKVLSGRPGNLTTRTLGSPFELASVRRHQGGRIATDGTTIVATEIAEGPPGPGGAGTREVERLGYIITASGVQETNLYRHTYSGGNADAGDIVRLGPGRFLGLVRDEWDNNFRSTNVQCRWLDVTASGFELGASHTMCDPLSNIAVAGGTVYAVTTPFSETRPLTLRSSTTGRSANQQTIALPEGQRAAGVFSDNQGRVHLLTTIYDTIGFGHAIVAGGARSFVELETTFSDRGIDILGMTGDDEVAILHYSSSGGVTTAYLTRELVCQ